jgi:DNA-binding transcriptional MerR regulator
MPTLLEYNGLAPFSLEELVDAANSVLRERPKLQVTKRTVRYYIQSGVLPPPQGSPKYARYGMDHLVRLCGARCLLDQGQPLQGAARDLDALMSGAMPEAIAHVQRLIDTQRGSEIFGSPAASAPASRIAEPRDTIYSSRSRRTPPELLMDVHDVQRIRLTDRATLELQGGGELRPLLLEAMDAIKKILLHS